MQTDVEIGRTPSALLDRALAQLFGELPPRARAAFQSSMEMRELQRGDLLFAEGDAPDHLYVLLTGRLEVLRNDEGTLRIIAEVPPGEPVGEVGVLAGDPRGAGVRAMRRSTVACWPRERMLALLQRFPRLMLHLCALVARRLRQPIRARSAGIRGAIVVLACPVTEPRAARHFADLRSLLATVPDVRLLTPDTPGPGGVPLRTLVRSGSEAGSRAWVEDVRPENGWAFLPDTGDDPAWTAFCADLADRFVMIRDADADPRPTPFESRIDALLGEHAIPRHLLLVHPSVDLPRGTDRWLASRARWRHHHVREGDDADRRRALRLITDTSVGLVLGGGGARGAAHLGVLRAVRAVGLPVDQIAGVSAGGGIAAHAAMQRPIAQMIDAFETEFVRRNPFRNFALPVFALFDELAMDAVARRLYGDVRIEDLWLNFFCTSCDISRSRKVLHHTGPLWQAVRATTSIPGILMPVGIGDDVLVDGGLLGNVPATDMRDARAAHVIAVDVSDTRPLRPTGGPPSTRKPAGFLVRRLLGRDRRVGPPSIVETLGRSATLAGKLADERHRLDADLWLRPPLGAYSGASFRALREIADIAEAHATPVLAQWASTTRIAFHAAASPAPAARVSDVPPRSTP